MFNDYFIESLVLKDLFEKNIRGEKVSLKLM